MKIAQNVIAVVLVLLGAIWTLQGANVMLGSFMSGQPQWLYIGIVMIVLGLGLAWWTNFRKPSGR